MTDINKFNVFTFGVTSTHCFYHQVHPFNLLQKARKKCSSVMPSFHLPRVAAVCMASRPLSPAPSSPHWLIFALICHAPRGAVEKKGGGEK